MQEPDDVEDADLLIERLMIEGSGEEMSDSESVLDVFDQWALIRWAPPRGTVACHESEAALFDPKSQDELRRALAVCDTCPLQQLNRCRVVAEHNEEHGVWGGRYYRYGYWVERPRFKGGGEAA